MSAPRYDLAIAGGGVTGLTAAVHARRAGLRVLLLEASPRVGGVIGTTRERGFLAEHGPNSLQRTAAFDRLVSLLGIEHEVIVAGASGSRRYVARGGVPHAIPTSPLEAIRTPLLSPRGKLRLLAEPWIRGAARDDETVAAFVRRRLGREVLDRLVNPFVAGVYAGDPERLGVAHAFPRLHALEREHGSLARGLVRVARGRRAARANEEPVRGGHAGESVSFRAGLQALTAALAAALGEAVRTRAPLHSADRTDDGWRLAIGTVGQTRAVDARAIVWAAPAHALRPVQWPAASRPHVDALATLRYATVGTLTLGFRRADIAHPLDGFGVLVPARERLAILGALFTSSLFPDRAPPEHATITCFLGGDRHPELGTAETDAVVALALADLRTLLGVRGAPAWVRHVSWPRAIPQYDTTHGRIRDAAAAMEAACPGLFVAGQAVDGVALGDCIAAGERAAERARAWLAEAPCRHPSLTTGIAAVVPGAGTALTSP
jgi:oxygen-dependent protoporphyrinogen oxidase